MPASKEEAKRLKGEKKRIREAMAEAEEIMGIENRFQITVLFDPGHDGDGLFADDGIACLYSTACVTTAQWDYQRAKMRWFPRITAEVTYNELLAIAVHEYCHVLLNPVDRHLKVKQHGDNELATENMTRAILAAAEIDYPQPEFHGS